MLLIFFVCFIEKLYFCIILKVYMTMATTATCRQGISPTDALWALYQSQTKKVREAFRLRILAEADSDKKEEEMHAYEQQLSAQERQAAYKLADVIKQGVADVRQAAANQTHVGHRAEDFLAELEQDEACK